MTERGGDGIDPEEQLRAALDRGERSLAVEALMAAYGKAVYRYCRRMVLDPDLADDVLQTTFLQAFEDCRRFHARSSMRTWLFGIARHRCLDALKARRRRQNRFDALDTVQEPADPAAGVDEALVASERRVVLAACLGQLNTRTREAILLRYEHGFSYAEMAAICHERPPTLQARVARAMPVLLRCMELKGIRP